MLTRKTEYQELGGDYFDKLTPKRTAGRFIKRLEEMGYTVTKTLEPVALAA